MAVRTRWIIAANAAASLIGAGIAAAVIPSSDGLISACYSKQTGALRVIDPPGERCKPNERPLSWNQQS
jgi:hypothetical protein